MIRTTGRSVNYPYWMLWRSGEDSAQKGSPNASANQRALSSESLSQTCSCMTAPKWPQSPVSTCLQAAFQRHTGRLPREWDTSGSRLSWRKEWLRNHEEWISIKKELPSEFTCNQQECIVSTKRENHKRRDKTSISLVTNSTVFDVSDPSVRISDRLQENETNSGEGLIKTHVDDVSHHSNDSTALCQDVFLEELREKITTLFHFVRRMKPFWPHRARVRRADRTWFYRCGKWMTINMIQDPLKPGKSSGWGSVFRRLLRNSELPSACDQLPLWRKE